MPKLSGRLTSALSGCAVLALTLGASPVQAQALTQSVQVQSGINQQAVTSQQRIDSLQSEADQMLADYRNAVRAADSLKVYVAQLRRVVDDQRTQLASMDSQLASVEETNRDIVPLMIEMVDMLDQIVANDIPFKLDERKERVAQLREILDRSDVTVSEKYRKVMEAYQIELDFGRNVAAYSAELPGTTRTVDFLYVGRTLLIYQTLDGAEQGWYNPTSKAFEALGTEYAIPIRDALRIAKNQAAPDLVKLPVPAPVRAN